MAGLIFNSRIGYISRYRKIISVLARYGFEDVVAHSPFKNLKWKRIIPSREGIPVTHYSRYERVRMVCEELGPTFIKLAQILSNRPDLLPEELITELEKLQDKVPPFPIDNMMEKLRAQLKHPVEDVFKSVEPLPIASASVAQVHKAILKNGEAVVLKIQRPDIRKTINADIAILKDLAGLVEKNSEEAATFQPLELIKTFEKAIKKELNFLHEATSIERFRKNFAGDDRIYIPKVYSEYSNSKILCLEFIPGYKVTDLESLKKLNVDTKQLARTGVDLYFQQIFHHGFFHADPHPGNVFIMEDKRICYLDFGMMGSIMPQDQELLGDLLYYIATSNVTKLSRTIQKIAINPMINIEEFELELNDYLEAVNVFSIDEVEISEVIEGLRDVLFEYKIFIPSRFHLLLRALVIVEGVGLHLDPDYQIMEEVQPYAKRLIERKYHPYTIARKLYNSLTEVGSIAANFPTDIKTIIEKVKQGKLHIEFEHKGLDGLNHAINNLARRMAFATIVGAMIVGTGLVIHSKIPPLVNNIPILGVIGFIFSAFFALVLLISLMRH